MISILLLGPPAILRDGQPLTVARRKSRALVFVLAVRRTPTPREQVLDLLWPNLPRAAAQQTLRSTLYGLRRMLGDALRADDATLALDPTTDVDLWQLADVLAARPPDPVALDAALARHRGELLAGFALEDAPAFEDWVETTRAHTQRMVIAGLVTLAHAHEEHGTFHAALSDLERALLIDPLQEDVQRAAMRVQYLAGDRVGAIRRYEQLSRRLDEELGVPPMAETRAVYDAIITDSLGVERSTLSVSRFAFRAPDAMLPIEGDRSASTTPNAQRASILPFTGRAAELYALGAITAGRQIALLEGEPGLGKTRLVEEFLRGSGTLVLAAAARELDRALPYQPVVEALRGLAALPGWPARRDRLALAPVWLAEAARLCPELAGANRPQPHTGSTADEARLREGLSQLLRAVAQQQRVTLFLDDLHWADASTLGLLGYVARQRLPGLALIAATRPPLPRSPLATLVSGLTREGLLGRVRLARLTDEETLALARHFAPADAATLAVWLARSAEGNPYVLAELVRHARASGLLSEDGSLHPEALGSGPIVPPTIYSLIESRLAPLSEPARRVLDAGVAAGRTFPFDVVAHAAALSEDTALDALDELVAAGLVRPVPPGSHDAAPAYAFDHTLTMEVAYLEVGEARHRRLHRRVGEALEALRRRRLDEVSGQIALHLREGGDVERAATFALRAGQRAAGLAAWSEAIGFFQQALEGAADEARGAVLFALGGAALNAGRYAEATDAYRTALTEIHGDASMIGEAQLALGRALLAQGRYAELISLAREVIASGDQAAAMRAELLWGTALSLEGDDLAGAAERLRRAESLADALGMNVTPEHLSHAHFELGSVLAQQGELEQAVGRYREALAAAEVGGPTALPWAILAHNNLAYHLHLLGDQAAERYAREGLRLAQEAGALGFQTYLLSTLGEIALACGDLDAAERHFAEGLALAERLGVPERIAGLTANLGLLAARRGEQSLAVQRLQDALAATDALGTHHLAAQVRLWLAALLPPDQARPLLAAARAFAERGGRKRLLEEVERAEADL
jgi:DNA-binding SARP family transcriptional activator/tetratricopeptide (TPR) repeat protein